jgi:FeS assembly SUF system protein
MNDESAGSRHRLPVLPSSARLDELRQQPRDRQTPTPVQEATMNEISQPEPSAPPAKTIPQKLLEGKVIEVLRQIYDPELPVNIYDLGLIYEIDVKDDNAVNVRMTLTAPACPVAGTLPGEVEKRVEAIPDVKSANVELVWEPPWSRDRMSEAAQLQLGLF